MEQTFFNRDLETADRKLIGERQGLRLKYLLREVLGSNAFYQHKLREAGLRSADDFQSPEDLSGLPFTTKQELVDDQEGHPLFGTNLTYAQDRYIRLHQTSGTTGKPLRWLDTLESWNWWARCWATIYRAADVRAGDRVFFPFSFGPFIGFWSAWSGTREVGALAISGGAQNTEQRLRNLAELSANVVCCTPSYALHLSELARRQDFNLRQSSVRALIVAGEPGGSILGTRQRIESEWGARVFDHTGATEVGAHGFTCQAQSGVHLNEAEFVAEVVDPQTGKQDDSGELVITNLGRVGSPVIRYRTGDMVSLDRAVCECGRTYVRMVGGILGRVDDMFTVRGVNIFPSAVENILRRYPEVIEFAVQVRSEGELDEMEIQVELAAEAPGPLPESLARELQHSWGVRVRVTTVAAGELPRYELKSRRFQDLRKEVKRTRTL